MFHHFQSVCAIFGEQAQVRKISRMETERCECRPNCAIFQFKFLNEQAGPFFGGEQILWGRFRVFPTLRQARDVLFCLTSRKDCLRLLHPTLLEGVRARVCFVPRQKREEENREEKRFDVPSGKRPAGGLSDQRRSRLPTAALRSGACAAQDRTSGLARTLSKSELFFAHKDIYHWSTD